MNDGALAGLVVLERDDRLATALCGSLLAELGATVVRLERGRRFPDLTEAAAAEALALARAGKLVVCEAAAWPALVQRADLVLLSPETAADRDFAQCEAARRVVCSITPLGLDALERRPGELALQAQAGIMACTGHADGAPEFVGVPLVESLAALNAATAALAALRVRQRDGAAQLVDIAGFDASLAIFATFVSTVATGKATGYRLGAGHHLCAPWNAYRTADGWVQLCTASDEEWRRTLQAIGRPELAEEPLFADAAGRVAAVGDVDALITGWTQQRSLAEVETAFAAASLPAGAVRDVPGLLRDWELRRRGVVLGEPGEAQFGSFLKLARTPGVPPARGETVTADGLLARLPVKSPAPGGKAMPPLADVRVLEIGPYTAGPLAGRYLADLGAEVIKIEPPGGEVSRAWSPRFGDRSGFFVNVNCGKKFLALDLKVPADRERLLRLAASADLLLENLKPGALARLGLGPEVLRRTAPGLIICSISGFGADGAARPALDTVVQAESGLMSLIGEPGRPQRVGVSIADQGAAHAAPLAILAALAERDRSGRGQDIDLAMRDVAAWMTRLAWPDGQPALRAWTRLRCADGWILVDRAPAPSLGHLVRSEAVAQLVASGIPATAIREMDEVFGHEAVARRGLVRPAGDGDAAVPVLQAPFGLTLTPPVNGRPYAAADADRAELLGS